MTEIMRGVRLHLTEAFRERVDLRPSLKYFHEKPEILEDRVDTFDQTCGDLQQFLRQDWYTNTDKYGWNGNAYDLKVKHKVRVIRPLSELSDIDQKRVNATLSDIKTQIRSGAWKFPAKVEDDRQVVSSLLIKGYGLYLARRKGSDEVGNSFVLAFQETLLRHSIGSGLFIDVLPWMVDERANFSALTKDYLEQVKDLPRSGQEQINGLPDNRNRDLMTNCLHEQVTSLMNSAGLNVLHSEARFNTDDRIRDKLLYMGDRPMMDVFGIRLVLDEASREYAIALILQKWNPPYVYPWGLSSRRDFKGERVPHGFSEASYRATHMNFVFDGKFICEVQIVNPDQYKTNLENEPSFRLREHALLARLKSND